MNLDLNGRFLAKSLQLSFNYPDVTDGLNIFRLSPGFTIDSPSNGSPGLLFNSRQCSRSRLRSSEILLQ